MSEILQKTTTDRNGFIKDKLGGDSFRIRTQIAVNGYSLSTKDSLVDTGAQAYLLVSSKFANEIVERLHQDYFIDFPPHPVTGFDGKSVAWVDRALRVTFRLEGYGFRDQWLLVVDMKHDIIVGRMFMAAHDALPDCRNGRLLFPDDLLRDPMYNYNISMDKRVTPTRDPAHQVDADRRDSAMNDEDRRLTEAWRKNPPRVLTRSPPAIVSARPQATVENVTEAESEPMEETPATSPPPTTREEAPLPVTEEGAVALEDLLPSKDPDRQVRFALPDNPLPARSLSADFQQRELNRMNRQLHTDAPEPLQMDEGECGFYERGARRERQRRTASLKRDNEGLYRLNPDGSKTRLTDIAVVGATGFMAHVHRTRQTQETPVSITNLHVIDKLIENKLTGEDGLHQDQAELRERLRQAVPKIYHDFLDVFSKAQSDALPPHRDVNHRIDLQDGKSPEELGHSPLYKMSLDELEVVRQYITENLQKGFIEPSSAPWAAPILLVRKAGGSGWRFCVDYRKLNALTIKDRYPLPLIEETLTNLRKARFFTKLDIRQAFHRIRMRPEDEDLTTFKTRLGTYKYKVLPFGLCNGPSSFQRFINNTLMEYLDQFCSAYIDDILIYSQTEAEHESHVRKILQKLRDAGLQADIKKCEFHVTETKFLGYIVGRDGVRVDPEKVAVVRDWKAPTTVKGVQSFLGFCNFYRKFVKEYGRIARPMTNLTRKTIPWVWTTACQESFDELKRRLLSAPILTHFQHDRETCVETDASDGVCAGCLLQKVDGEWHPVAFFSETMHGAEMNYAIHDKELLAVVKALTIWRAELTSVESFRVLTDHEALKYFGTKRLLNSRQASWAQLLSQYRFEITYRPGKENVLADALSRKQEDLTTQKAKKEAQREIQIFGLLRNDSGTEVAEISPLPAPDRSELRGYTLIDHILRANQTAESLATWRQSAANADGPFKLTEERILTREGKLVVPTEDPALVTALIDECHSRAPQAHPGRDKTRRLVSERYWWHGLGRDVDRFVANCMDCCASKVPRQKPQGLLRTIPPPLQSWKSLVVDFCKLPEDNDGYNNVFVMIDRLSKTAWSTPCRDTATAADTAKMYYDGPFRIFGLPEVVTSDRGPQFIADFTDEMSKILGIKWKLASSGHSQTAGQVEIMNQYLEQRLRPFVNHYQRNWSRVLPAMDHAQNSLPHSSTDCEPHEVLFGFRMPTHFDWEKRTTLKELPVQRERLARADAQEMADTIRQWVAHARKTIEKSQQAQTEYANRSRREGDFAVGDQVFIVKRTYQTDRPSVKLDYPMTRQHYKVLEVWDNNCKLETPDDWKGTSVFHMDRLRKYPNDPLPGQGSENPGSEIVDGEEEWEVEKVVTSRVHYGKLQYQVEWRGWDPDPVWYPASNFKNSAKLLQAFHEENPESAGPPTRLEIWRKAAEKEEYAPDHKDDDKPAAKGTVRTRSAARLRTK